MVVLETLKNVPTPKVCLNMIVKNESKVILRLLNSVYKFIDSYCICDTGSTDDTVSIITTFFNEKNISGKIAHQQFRDFGYNRTYALMQCENMSDVDYILLMDADMVLRFNENEIINIKNKLVEYTAFYIFQGSNTFHYKNVRIVKNNSGMKYWGVTHEYVEVPKDTVYGILKKEELFIDDIGDGGSKSDKFLRDIRLLTKGLEETPNNDRYTFYLANSYKDSGQLEKAIETYKKRIEIGGWVEEVWYSNVTIGRIYKRMGDMERAIFYWLEAYTIYPNRIENLYEIVHYYRDKGKNQLAYQFYVMARQQMKEFPNFDYLFLEKDVYDFKLDYEFSIIGYYCNKFGIDLVACCMKLFGNPNLEEWMFKNILSNYKFYSKKIQSIKHKKSEQLLQIGKDFVSNPDFLSSSPSICYHNDEFYVNLRYVNYSINEKGEYINKDKIETINVLSTFSSNNEIWINTDEKLLKHDTQYDNLYVGLEDVKLFSYKNKLYYNANRGLSYGNIVAEHGEIDLETGNTNSMFLRGSRQNSVEKNWVLFEDGNGDMKCIYKWFPLTIGNIIKNENKPEINYEVTNEIGTNSLFKHLRGSTNGIRVDNEIWFVCHSVSYEDRRYYYHIIVAMDPITYSIKRYTPFFTFEKEKVEYTLGFTYKNGELTIGYSIMDKKSEYIVVEKSTVEQMFLQIK